MNVARYSRQFLIIAVALTTACGRPGDAPILLFTGTGTSPGDVRAIEAVLDSNHLAYATVNTSRLNEMGERRLRTYRLLIIPGGNFIDIGKGLSTRTTAKVRSAVQSGLNYLGICAGGFLAGNLHPTYNSFDLTSGVKFGFYSVEDQGIHKAAVPIAEAEGPTIEHYWEDGPQFTGWGDIVAKYPDGTPAVVEGNYGAGWMILAGVHPEAPESWRQGMTFKTPASTDNAYAATLIQSGLNRRPLPHY